MFYNVFFCVNLLKMLLLFQCIFRIIKINMVDYRKWDHIEVSDDEDDTHPNIDTPSLFKWRHEARVQRMEEMQKKKETVEEEKKRIEAKLREVRERVAREEAEGSDNLDDLRKTLEEVEKTAAAVKEKEVEVLKEVKSQPLNVDTLSKDGFSKSIINTAPLVKEELSEEEKEKKMKKFVQENKKLIKEYGMLQKFDDSKKFLMDGNTHLACEETANYLVIWCLDLEMEEKSELMAHVAHQCICMQYLLELAKQLETDPRACISSFFSKIQIADQEYKNAFYSELDAFKVRIKKRAQEKIAEALEEERLERLGPGGLDPAEVFESLPQSMKDCFESQDIPLLQKVGEFLPETDTLFYLIRCVDSGLWVPSKEDPTTSTEDGFVKKDEEIDGDDEPEEEEVYSEVK
ncbi:hsp90 co-chaperone Cdc37 [Eurytemora carolleeae]|uniref:hsp90 co-chaperone Cdc37 n=1 Tax=Eurytemora carolleeae TaxID=1294199 RepID=UPI000C77B986|nr:hsp90 co-chaperone Cdc37 [Eurytemora carolleeae]|eukprot:XP_023332389.1 hsp90 co-chaperone Cdc37-like [Eurytemora affinis]